MASIFDVFGRLLLDDTQFQTDVAKSAEKAGITTGERMSATLKRNGAKVLGAGLATGFAIATKGLIELDNVTAQFQATTGATAEEAERAGKAINAMAGRNLQPLSEVGDALAKVHTDLGLTGEAAEKTTEQFLKFATATGQDAGQAVLAFDDILDNWGLTAADAQGVMDKLIVSHQRWGGSIEDNERTLAKLAPAMQAANFQIDDGIGLLGLFGAKGLDSERAAAAFSKALTKVKSPQELKRLIKDIQDTEDPFLRAQKAADLFGAKAGAQLANALGGANLDDYAVSVTDAAGATERAAGVIEDSLSNRVKLALKGASAALIDFGGSFGPALTGVASLASLAGGLGGGKLAKGLLGGLVGLGGKLKARLLEAILSAVVPATIAGEAVGAATAEGVETGMQTGRVQGLVGKAASGLGKVWGSLLGKAFVLGALAVIGAELWQQLQDLAETNRQQVRDIGSSIDEEIAKGIDLGQTKAALEKGISDLNGPLDLFRVRNAEQITALQAQLDKVNAVIEGNFLDTTAAARRSAEDIGKAADSLPEHFQQSAQDIGKAVKRVPPVVATAGHKTRATFDQIAESSTKMKTTIKANLDKVKTAAHDLTTKLTDEAQALIDGYYDPIIAADDLRVQKDQVAADKAALAATKAGTAERDQAKLTLAESEKALDQTRLNLLSAGKLSGKDQTAWLKELKDKYKTATGAAKKNIGSLIAKIEQLQNIQKPGIVIKVNVTGHAVGHGPTVSENAAGGPIGAGEVSWVGEEGRELFAPRVPGVIIPHTLSEAMAAAGSRGGDTYSTTVQLLDKLEVRTPRDISDNLRMLERRGYSAKRRGGRR